MNLHTILKYFEDEGVGEIAVNLFRDHIPDDVKKAIGIFCMAPTPIDPYTTVVKGSFQVVVRDTTSESLNLNTKKVIEVFRGGKGLTLADMKFFFIRPEHEPLSFPRSDSSYLEATVSFEFSYIRQT